ncbi:FAD-binding dehydrogenase [Pseudonocardiaceae bacterium YIM PH 21723]|nr:FAD-binding dehydrogenase [Pseudonocardiaceae bacterium YIM PH 21723]
MALDADVIVVGGGLSGLVATAELADAGRRVILLDQEPEVSLGGQAFWSFGGLMFVDSPEQRRLGIRDSHELALSDWMGTAGFDREEDHWPRQWAEAYVDFTCGEKRAWLHDQGVRWFPVVQWAERGGYPVGGHGNSVPRFHVTWGTGPGLIEPFVNRVRAAVEKGLVSLRFRHRVTELTVSGGAVDGVRGEVLEASSVARGEKSSRTVAADFELKAQAVIVTSGGIGGNHDLVRRNWPSRMGPVPQHMISGVPDHVDGLMLDVVRTAGGGLINEDRMWHYPEGIQNHSPIWTRHGIRILSGPSPLWLDATGRRLPPPLFPGFDCYGALEHIAKTGHSHSWFVANRRTVGVEFGLSGSEQNPDLTGKTVRGVLERRKGGMPAPLQAFLDDGADFIQRDSAKELADAMNALTGQDLIDPQQLADLIRLRDQQVHTGLGKDPQVVATSAARRYIGDRLTRIVKPHAITDPDSGPLVAVRLHILTRKTLGGVHTDLSARVLRADGSPLPGVYAAGEVAGFGGGGVHGYRALEGTFLGGCLFSGRIAGRAAAKATG